MTTPNAPASPVLDHPEALPAETGRYFFLETEPDAEPPRAFITPVAAWLGVAPPAEPLRRALDPRGRVLEAPPGGHSEDQPVDALFAAGRQRAGVSSLTWAQVYEAASAPADGSPRREWSDRVPEFFPPPSPVLMVPRIDVDPDGSIRWVAALPGTPDRAPAPTDDAPPRD